MQYVYSSRAYSYYVEADAADKMITGITTKTSHAIPMTIPNMLNFLASSEDA